MKSSKHVYRYLVIEEYHNSKRKQLLRLPVEEAMKKLLQWCGGWDSNPRRPTPSGPKPSRSQGFDGGLLVDEGLLGRFREWLLAEGLSEESKQFREYLSKLSRLEGKYLTPSLVHDYAGRSKRWYELLRRLITFIRVPSGLGMRELAFELRESLPRKPRSGSDTYVPPVGQVVEAGRRLRDTRYYPLYLLLVSTGARLTTLLEVLEDLDSSRLVELGGVARYHVDYLRGEKVQWLLYGPAEVWRAVLKSTRPPDSYDLIAEKVRAAGVAVKHYRNFVYNAMLGLGVPEGVVEFIVGHAPSTIGRRSYLAKIVQADRFYPVYAQWLRRNVLAAVDGEMCGDSVEHGCLGNVLDRSLPAATSLLRGPEPCEEYG